jgi:hypothetical protein
MFAVDEPTAEAIRRAWHEGGELSGIVEFKRHFPLIDNDRARMCVQAILSWKPKPAGEQEVALQPVDEIDLARFVVHLTGMVVSSGVGTATKSPVGHDGVVGGDAALTRPCLL